MILEVLALIGLIILWPMGLLDAVILYFVYKIYKILQKS